MPKNLIDILLLFLIIFCFEMMKSDDEAQFILSETAVAPGQFPFLVKLVTKNGRFECSGTILTETKVITSAHCLITDKAKIVVAGSVDMMKTNKNEQRRKISNYQVHPKYRRSSRSLNDLESDLGIVTLRNGFSTSFFVRKIELAENALTVCHCGPQCSCRDGHCECDPTHWTMPTIPTFTPWTPSPPTTSFPTFTPWTPSQPTTSFPTFPPWTPSQPTTSFSTLTPWTPPNPTTSTPPLTTSTSSSLPTPTPTSTTSTLSTPVSTSSTPVSTSSTPVSTSSTPVSTSSTPVSTSSASTQPTQSTLTSMCPTTPTNSPGVFTHGALVLGNGNRIVINRYSRSNGRRSKECVGDGKAHFTIYLVKNQTKRGRLAEGLYVSRAANPRVVLCGPDTGGPLINRIAPYFLHGVHSGNKGTESFDTSTTSKDNYKWIIMQLGDKTSRRNGQKAWKFEHFWTLNVFYIYSNLQLCLM